MAGAPMFEISGDIHNLFTVETDAALEAAREVPGDAAIATFDFIVTESLDHVYSGAFSAAHRIGLNDLPNLPGFLSGLTDKKRHERHRKGRPYTPADVSRAETVARNFKLGDDIIFGNELFYADQANEVNDQLYERAREVATNVLGSLVARFNQRFRSKRGSGLGGRRRRRR